MRKCLSGILIVLFIASCSQQELEQQKEVKNNQFYKPWEVFPELFHDVQMSGVFEDSKTFVDCEPLQDPALIAELYDERKNDLNFDLKDFVLANFSLPQDPSNKNFETNKPFEKHLNEHWDYLTRSAKNPDEYSTLIALPKKYIVPGGRFREIYYWDSYFSMIGLGVSGRKDLVRSMLDNFAYQLDTIGYIPNGNRTYFLGRSQPPFFGAMVNLYAKMTTDQYAAEYLDVLRKEYDFWMKGQYEVSDSMPSRDRVVYYKGYVLNRYYDNAGGPREESYREDIELAENVLDEDSLYLNLRAACESGWDFSARWFEDPDDFASIRTTEILPVDLNSLLYHTELVLSRLYRVEENEEEAQKFVKAAENRYNAMNELFWNDDHQMFQDILWQKELHTGKVTAASFYPLYFKLSNRENADNQLPILLDSLLRDGGVLTSTLSSGQQWDAPNGWAPLNWIAYKGLQHYEFEEEAEKVRTSWLTINKKIYRATGKMMEKYNVVDTTLSAGGGEYPNQDGFGWTNGVALGMEADDPAY